MRSSRKKVIGTNASGKKWLLRIMSNVKKKDASVHTPASADSTINQDNYNEDYKKDKYFLKWAKDSGDTIDINGYSRYKGCQENEEYITWCKERNVMPQTYANHEQYNKEFWEKALGEKL